MNPSFSGKLLDQTTGETPSSEIGKCQERGQAEPVHEEVSQAGRGFTLYAACIIIQGKSH